MMRDLPQSRITTSCGQSVKILSDTVVAILIIASLLYLIYPKGVKRAGQFLKERTFEPIAQWTATNAAAWLEEEFGTPVTPEAVRDKINFDFQRYEHSAKGRGHLWQLRAEKEMTTDEKMLSKAIHEEFATAGLEGEFDTDREKLRNLRTRELIKPLNKGFILHLHDNSMLSAEKTLEEATKRTSLWMSFTEEATLINDRIKTRGLIELRVKDESRVKEKKEDKKQHIKKDGPEQPEQPVKEVNEEDKKDKEEGPIGRVLKPDEWVRIEPFLNEHFSGDKPRGIECIAEHLKIGPEAGWKEFRSLNPQFKKMMTESVFRWKFEQLIEQCKELGFSGALARIMVFQKITDDRGVGEIGIISQLDILKKVIEEKRQSGVNVRISLILATSRQFNSGQLKRDLDSALDCIEKHRDLIRGFDVVGQEDVESQARSPEIERFVEEAAGKIRTALKNGTKPAMHDENIVPHGGEALKEVDNSTGPIIHDVNVVLHAGEAQKTYLERFGTRWALPNKNVQLALDLGCKSISHFLAANDFQILQAIRQGVVIEACFISAQKLQTLDRIGDHPIHKWLDMGLMITVSPDNPSLYGCDFFDEILYLLWLGGEHCLWVLRAAITNSIKGCAMNDEIEKNYLVEFERDWAEWITTSIQPLKNAAT